MNFVAHHAIISVTDVKDLDKFTETDFLNAEICIVTKRVWKSSYSMFKSNQKKKQNQTRIQPIQSISPSLPIKTTVPVEPVLPISSVSPTSKPPSTPVDETYNHELLLLFFWERLIISGPSIRYEKFNRFWSMINTKYVQTTKKKMNNFVFIVCFIEILLCVFYKRYIWLQLNFDDAITFRHIANYLNMKIHSPLQSLSRIFNRGFLSFFPYQQELSCLTLQSAIRHELEFFVRVDDVWELKQFKPQIIEISLQDHERQFLGYCLENRKSADPVNDSSDLNPSSCPSSSSSSFSLSAACSSSLTDSDLVKPIRKNPKRSRVPNHRQRIFNASQTIHINQILDELSDFNMGNILMDRIPEKKEVKSRPHLLNVSWFSLENTKTVVQNLIEEKWFCFEI